MAKLPLRSAFQSDGIYTDGGCLSSGTSNRGGVWAWCRVEKGVVVSSMSGILVVKDVVVPVEAEQWCEEEETGMAGIEINLMELYAAIRGLEAWRQRYPLHKHVHLLTDSGNTRGRLKSNWSMKGVPFYIQDRMKEAILGLELDVTLLSGHPNAKQMEAGIGPRGYPCSEHNVWCDKECKRLSRLFNENYRHVERTRPEPSSDDVFNC